MRIETKDLEQRGFNSKEVNYYFNNYDEISSGAADKIVEHSRDRDYSLVLEGIKSLPDQIAETLSRYKGRRIELPGIENLTASAASKISGHRGDVLKIGVGNELDCAMLASLQSYSGHLILVRVSQITPDALDGLASAKFETITFSQLLRILPGQFEKLRNLGNRFGGVSVTELNEEVLINDVPCEIDQITAIAPEALRQERLITEKLGVSGSLELPSLTHINSDFLRWATSGRYSSLCFESVANIDGGQTHGYGSESVYLRIRLAHELDSAVAVTLSFFLGHLSLPGIEFLSAATEDALCEFKGESLCLPDLKSIRRDSPLLNLGAKLKLTGVENFPALADYPDVQITPSLLKEIDAEGAKVLIQLQNLDLRNLNHLNQDVALVLAKHDGRELQLGGVNNLSAELEEILSKYQGESLCLPDIKSMRRDSPLLNLGAKLKLTGVEHFPALADFPDVQITPSRLTEIDAEGAKVLIPLQNLDLSNVSHLDQETAMALSHHTGELRLGRLEKLNPELLEKQSGVLCLMSRHSEHVKNSRPDLYESSNMHVADKICSVMPENFGLFVEQVRVDADVFLDYGFDSLDSVEFFLLCEELFDVNLTESDFDTIRTLTILTVSTIIWEKVQRAGEGLRVQFY